jgi:hypothetical protein
LPVAISIYFQNQNQLTLLTIAKHAAMLCSCIVISSTLIAQDSSSLSNKVLNFPAKLFKKINNQTGDLDKQLTQQTAKYLQRLANREAKMREKLTKHDSTGAKTLYAQDPQVAYNALLQRLKKDSATANRIISGQYLPFADSLKTALNFLNKNPQLLDLSKIAPGDLQSSLSRINQLQSKMQDADQIQQFIQQRKEQFKQYLSRFTKLPSGVSNLYAGYNKQLYYYSAQVNAYKEMLNDPDKMFKTALGLLNRLPAFSSFMQKNSLFAGLFHLPAPTGPSGPLGPSGLTQTATSGMATRSQVSEFIKKSVGTGIPNIESFTQKSIQSAQGQLDQVRSKLSAFGTAGGEIDVPNFQPNDQKTKSLFKRLQYGFNMQTLHSSTYFPTTTDIGLSLGYKLDNKNVIGVGASYKMGWGNDVRHIQMSSQGIGLRSFLDINIEKTFYASGGFEYNYQQPFTSFQQINNLDCWQQSGLIGITKMVSMNTKMLKETKLQVFWDFLSYQQVPRTAPFKFRIGYNF